MKRSFGCVSGFWPWRRAAGIGRGSAARCNAVQGAGLCVAVQLDRVLPRHQRRRRLGQFGLEYIRQQQQPVGRHDRRHRRLQLARRRQPMGVRHRRRHRLGQHQGQHAPAARPHLRNQEQLVRHRARPRRLCVRPVHAVLHRRRWRSATSKPTAPASPASRTPTPAGPSASASKASIVGNWTAKVEYLYADLGDIELQRVACGVATNVDLQLNIVRARYELPLLINNDEAQTLKPRTVGPGLQFFRASFAECFSQTIRPRNSTTPRSARSPGW